MCVQPGSSGDVDLGRVWYGYTPVMLAALSGAAETLQVPTPPPLTLTLTLILPLPLYL